ARNHHTEQRTIPRSEEPQEDFAPRVVVQERKERLVNELACRELAQRCFFARYAVCSRYKLRGLSRMGLVVHYLSLV
ncbi:MAG: hypothetical protein AAFY77_02920, partial [Pseudomonadota bacterium]